MARTPSGRRRPAAQPPSDAVLARDRAITTRMAESDASMPLEYMEKNMHWYAQQAERYEKLAAAHPGPNRFRNKKDREAAQRRIDHLEAMAIKFRALNQASAESAANYTHARIQSVSANASRNSKGLTIILTGDDARL